MVQHPKKLIEVALPLEAINAAAAREKSIRHGHPSTLHLWWARRPLAAARAVIFAQMVDDPSSAPDLFPTEAKQQKERERLFRIIEELVKWENTTNERVLAAARAEIWQSWRRACAEHADHPRAKELFDRHRLPAFHDPFAGGGALPLEAQRLGLEAYASDLNPVAVLINKAMIEIPPKFAGRPPVNPEARHTLFGEAPGAPPGAPASSRQDPKEWRSRGYLPHREMAGLVQSITFRLADSLPQEVLERWAEELAALPEADRQTERERRIRAWLDQGHGACWLRDERLAGLVEDALLHFDGQRYRLLAWCVMPNHVHALIETIDGYPLADVVHSWKSYTANQANKLLSRTGAFWQREYHDRFIRDHQHLQQAIDYIDRNPVQARLVEEPAEWRFSSAGRGEAGEDVGQDAGKDAGAPGGAPGAFGMWRGAQGLAEDVRYYGQWMRDEAAKRIGHLYPTIEITAEMVAGSAGFQPARPDLQPLVGRQLTVIAWLWARTVKSPNPAFREVDVPLASTFMLSTKPGKEAWVEVVAGSAAGSAGVPPASELSPSHAAYHFVVQTTAAGGTPALPAKNGTKLARGANFHCVMSGTPIAGDYIKAEGKAGRMGARLMAIVAEGDRGRVYLAPTPEHEAAAKEAKPEWKPEGDVPARLTGGTCVPYGLSTWGDLFMPRQLVALTTFSDLVGEAMEKVRADAEAWERRLPAGLAWERRLPAGVATGRQAGAPTPLRDGGTGAAAYAEAVGVYLGFAIDRMAMTGNSLVRWNGVGEKAQHCFGRQALPMLWDFAEPNFLASATGSAEAAVFYSYDPLEWMCPPTSGFVSQSDAATQSVTCSKLVSTDPPYYDNIGYADLSDFFYVWLRRSLSGTFPELFATLAVPKAEELVATPYRHGSKEKAETFFLDGMTKAMHRLVEQAHPAFPVTIYYAFKQSETESTEGTSSTGWETFLDAVIRAGFGISGTWPMRTEMKTRQIAMGTNALASSIVLVCRKREATAPTATRREFVAALKSELPTALRHLQAGNIAPVDLAQAAIGPGMAVYTRYAKVLDAEGKPVAVREALALINQVLDETLAEQEGDFDADTRFAIVWFEQHGFAEGEYGVAETLSKAKNTSVGGLAEAKILESKRGKVRLLRPEELTGSVAFRAAVEGKSRQDAGAPSQADGGAPSQADGGAPSQADGGAPSQWETVHHLVRVLEAGGEGAAAELTAKLGSAAETARELAYRLYAVCERKRRAAEALSYNALVQSWPEVSRLAQAARPAPSAVQQSLFEGE